MPIDHAQLFLDYVTCPHCGERFTPPAPDVPELSPLAYAIITYNGPNHDIWRRGHAVPLRTWAIRVNADPHTVRAAMRELVRVGLASTIPYGQKGRVQYVGVPSMLQRYAPLAA